MTQTRQPEAAPLQMPKPVGWLHRHPKECKNGEVCNYRIASADRKDGWEESPVYTEQQVRAMLSTGVQAQADAQDTDRWMGIGKAIERACMDLPDGTEISVSLEKDAGTVTLIDQDGNEHENFSCDYGFAGVLNEAIDVAIAAQAKKGGAA